MAFSGKTGAMAIKLAEKRRFPRIGFRAPIKYQVRGRPENGCSVSDNISARGLRLRLDKFITPSTLLTFEISVLSKTVRPVGQVAWISRIPYSDRYKSGVEFVELDPREESYLKDYINIVRETEKINKEGADGS